MLAYSFSPAPGISEPGPRDHEVTDSRGPERKTSGPSQRWELESQAGTGLLPTLFHSQQPASMSSLTFTQTSDQHLCLGPGRGVERVERRGEPIAILLSQSVACYTRAGFLPGWRHSLLRLLQPGFCFLCSACTGRGPGPAAGSPRPRCLGELLRGPSPGKGKQKPRGGEAGVIPQGGESCDRK